MARLVNNAPPGSLFKGPAPARDRKYLVTIRSLPCLICCVTPCREAAHVRMSSQAGMGRKPSDHRAVPLCHRHHMEQHEEGERQFWDRIGIDPLSVSDELNRAYPDRDLMTTIVLRCAA